MQRSDSRKQARELQQEFLQKAKEDLEAFQQTSSRASQACVPQSRVSLEDTGISVDVDQQPEDAGDWNMHAVQERRRTTLEKRLEKQLSRCISVFPDALLAAATTRLLPQLQLGLAAECTLAVRTSPVSLERRTTHCLHLTHS